MQREWDEFIVQLDKVLSENIRHDALDAAGTPRKESHIQMLGTLTRLANFIEGKGIDKAVVTDLMRPLREIRRARQKPAHALRTNITEETFGHRQVALLEGLNDALRELGGVRRNIVPMTFEGLREARWCGIHRSFCGRAT